MRLLVVLVSLTLLGSACAASTPAAAPPPAVTTAPLTQPPAPVQTVVPTPPLPTVAVVLPVNVPRVATVAARPSPVATEPAEMRAHRLEREHPLIDPRVIEAEPSAYVGQKIHVRGLALDVKHDSAKGQTWVHLLAQIDPEERGTESMVVELPRDPAIVKDSCWSFFGTVEGSQRVTRVISGREEDVPLVRATDWLERYIC